MRLGFRTKVWGSFAISLALPSLTLWLCPHLKALGFVGTLLQSVAVAVAFVELNALDKKYNGKGFWLRMCPPKVLHLKGQDLVAGRPTLGNGRVFTARLTNVGSPTLEGRVEKLETDLAAVNEKVIEARKYTDQKVLKAREAVGRLEKGLRANIDDIGDKLLDTSGASESDIGWGYSLLIFATVGTIVSTLADFV